MKLNEAINKAIDVEKTTNKNSILYKVYENSELIYVGVGGRGTRPGSGRLKEHRGVSVFSSFRHQYYWYNAPKFNGIKKEIDHKWDKLEWEIIQFNQFKDVYDLEEQLIHEFNPMFNRDKR